VISKKNLLLKVWPDLTDYIPATVPFSGIQSKATKGKNLLLDFDNCKKVNSSGLNILLIQLLKLTHEKSYERPWEFFPEKDTPSIDKIHRLGLFSKLNKYSPISDLFWDDKYNTVDENGVVEDLNSGELIKSYPIFSLKIDGSEPNRREALLGDLRTWCYDRLFPVFEKFDFNFINVMNIITEIGKNTSDHTESDLFLGLDVIHDKSDNYIKIHFSIGDIGKGINLNIKDNYQKGIKKMQADRTAHWDLTFAYRWALTTGNTTKFTSKANKGLGMASIIESSRKVPMELSVFDAQSRGILSNMDSLSHQKVRKNFHTVGKQVGFYYYGEILANKRK
jgi:hypothetical protein